jgi:topoisomerase-4 subunit A
VAPPSSSLHRTEKVVATAVIAEHGTLVVHAGKRFTNLKGDDLANYIGKRAQRGLKLPRGFQNVDTIHSSSASRAYKARW